MNFFNIFRHAPTTQELDKTLNYSQMDTFRSLKLTSSLTL